MSVRSRSNWNSEILVFKKRGKPEQRVLKDCLVGCAKALKVQQRFGQPHIVAYQTMMDKGCRNSLTAKRLLRSLNVLSEMNMSNLAKMLGKLPVVLQIKWRDEALRMREDLVEFNWKAS